MLSVRQPLRYHSGCSNLFGRENTRRVLYFWSVSPSFRTGWCSTSSSIRQTSDDGSFLMPRGVQRRTVLDQIGNSAELDTVMPAYISGRVGEGAPGESGGGVSSRVEEL